MPFNNTTFSSIKYKLLQFLQYNNIYDLVNYTNNSSYTWHRVDITVLSIIFGPTFLYSNTSIYFTLMMQKTVLKVTTKSLYPLGHSLMLLQTKTDTQPEPNAKPLITKQ